MGLPPDGASAIHADARAAISAALAEAGAAFDVQDAKTEGGAPFTAWRLHTIPALKVQVRLFEGEHLHVIANACEARFHRAAVEGFAGGCAELVRSLASAPLELRPRRTVLGGRAGAIRLVRRGQPRWCGDPLAVIGLGREERHERWLAP